MGEAHWRMTVEPLLLDPPLLFLQYYHGIAFSAAGSGSVWVNYLLAWRFKLRSSAVLFLFVGSVLLVFFITRVCESHILWYSRSNSGRLNLRYNCQGEHDWRNFLKLYDFI